MEKPSVRCALLAVLVAKHRWGSPLGREALLAMAAIDESEYPAAREAFADLRSATYIENRGKRGIQLDPSAFGRLADVLYHECDWKPYEIESRLKHYEGWDRHDWQ
jgi:hypothetical protein